MKYCVNCGKEIKADAKFCPFCGTTQPGMDNGIPKAELAEKGRNYFNYLNHNVAQPLIGETSDTGFFGLINFGLITLFLSLALSHSLARIMQVASYQGNFPAMIEFCLLIAGMLFVSLLVVYFVVRQVYQEPIGFLEAFDRLFAPASLAVYISFALLLFSFIVNATTSLLFSLLFSLVILLIQTAFLGNIWVTHDLTERRNRYYLNIGAVIIHGILQSVVLLIFISMIVNKIGASIESIINSFY